MKGKCAGGKSLGISLNFKSEKELLKYIRENYAPCSWCGVLYKKKNLKGTIEPQCTKCLAWSDK
jgi:hypothetical protein